MAKKATKLVRSRKAPEPSKTLEALRAKKYPDIDSALLLELLEIQQDYSENRKRAVEKQLAAIEKHLDGGDG